MTEDLTAGLDFQEDGEDFVLSVTGRSGVTTTVRLTEDQVMALSQSAPMWRDRIVLRRSPSGGDASAVVVTPVTHIGIQPDSLKTSVLLTLQSTTRGRLTFGLPPGIARLALEHLPRALKEIEGDRPTKQ